MNKKALILIVAIISSQNNLWSETAISRSITLPESFKLALKRSESISIQKNAIEIALAQVDQLASAIKPRINLNAAELWQPTSTDDGQSSPLTKKSLPSAQITLQQPLFSGFREFLAYKAGKLRSKSAEMDETRAESLLYQDVAQSYLELWRLQQEIRTREAIVDATSDRIKELTRWVDLGRSRRSEMIAARSQLAQTKALIEIAKGEEAAAQETLKFFTGLNENLIPQNITLPDVEPLENLLAKIQDRPDIAARREDVEISKLSTSISKRQRWPTVGLTSDYYLKRYGVQSDIHWDAIFSASLPLYEGGLIRAQVAGAEAGEHSAEQSLSLTVRRAEMEIRTFFRNVQWTNSALKTLENAVQLAEENMKAQTEDYKLSRVTNLEVLDSLNTLENTRLTMTQIQEQAIFSRIQLDVAIGRHIEGSNPR